MTMFADRNGGNFVPMYNRRPYTRGRCTNCCESFSRPVRLRINCRVIYPIVQGELVFVSSGTGVIGIGEE